MKCFYELSNIYMHSIFEQWFDDIDQQEINVTCRVTVLGFG